MNIINNRIAYNTVRDIRSKAFSHMQTLPVAFADSHPYGDIVSRITADAEQFATDSYWASRSFSPALSR